MAQDKEIAESKGTTRKKFNKIHCQVIIAYLIIVLIVTTKHVP